MTEEKTETTQPAPIETKEAVAPAEQSKEDEEMREVEVWEFGLAEEEIDGLIGKLNELKQTKTQVSFDIDEENEFLISYLNEEEEVKETQPTETEVPSLPNKPTTQ